MSIFYFSASGQTENLPAQLEKLQEECKQWDVIKSDWVIEKGALEEALVAVREALSEQQMTLDKHQAC